MRRFSRSCAHQRLPTRWLQSYSAAGWLACLNCTHLSRLHSTWPYLQAINRTSEIIECTHSRVDLDRILGLQASRLWVSASTVAAECTHTACWACRQACVHLLFHSSALLKCFGCV